MPRAFKHIAFFFFIGFGAVYLTADFLLHHAGSDDPTVKTIYDTFDMPFFFTAGMYALASMEEWLRQRFQLMGLTPLFLILGLAWMMALLYLNLGYDSFL